MLAHFSEGRIPKRVAHRPPSYRIRMEARTSRRRNFESRPSGQCRRGDSAGSCVGFNPLQPTIPYSKLFVSCRERRTVHSLPQFPAQCEPTTMSILSANASRRGQPRPNAGSACLLDGGSSITRSHRRTLCADADGRLEAGCKDAGVAESAVICAVRHRYNVPGNHSDAGDVFICARRQAVAAQFIATQDPVVVVDDADQG